MRFSELKRESSEPSDQETQEKRDQEMKGDYFPKEGEDNDTQSCKDKDIHTEDILKRIKKKLVIINFDQKAKIQADIQQNPA